MKKETTATRLKKIMEERNLRQVDILDLTKPYCLQYGVKMNKSDISQYCSGKTEPNQDKLFVLGQALNVNEAWLMGYDVEMERGEILANMDEGLLEKLKSNPKKMLIAEWIANLDDEKMDRVERLLDAVRHLSIEK